MKTGQRYRTIWVSDFHLGTRECTAHYLLDFLRCNDYEILNLVGDIFDGWALARYRYRQQRNDVIQKLLRKALKGTRVILLPGNQDEFARDYIGLHFGYVEEASDHVHTTADGMIRHARWLSRLGARVYQATLILNRWVNNARCRPGLPYWSLSVCLKHNTKRAVQFTADVQSTMVQAAVSHRADSIGCGHVHHAEIRMMDGHAYANCGDWVEDYTAVVEHFYGSLDLVQWVASEDHAISIRHGGDGCAGQIPAIMRPALHPEQVQ